MYSVIDLLSDLHKANRGRKFLERVWRQCAFGGRKPMVVFFPEQDRQYYDVFNSNYGKYVKADKNVVILSDNPDIEKELVNDGRFIFMKVGARQKEDIIRSVALGNNYKWFWFMSITIPEERKCDQLIGKKGITFEKVIVQGIMENS